MKLLPYKSRNINGRNAKRVIMFEWMIDYYMNIPYFHKKIVDLSLLLYFLSFCTTNFIKFLSINTQHIDFRIIYRVFTSVFINFDSTNLILILVLWLNETISIEKSVGTLQYALDFFINLIIIQILFITTSLVFQIKYFGNFLQSSGLWPIVLFETVLICQNNPEEIVNFYFFLYDFRAKYFPCSLLLFLIVINDFQIKLDIIIGLLYGYLYHKFLENVLKFPSLSKKLELIFISRFKHANSINPLN